MRTLTIYSVAAAIPWEAYLLPCSLQITPSQRDIPVSFLQRLTELIENRHALQRHLFLHTWKLSEEGVGTRVQENLAAWQPRLGMGLFPNRQPPTLLTQEAFMDANADRVQQKEPELPVYRMLHLDAPPDQRSNAATLLFGHGATTQMFSSGTFDEMKQASMAFYLPTIKAPIYTHERFYLPLLDGPALAAAPSPEIFSTWMGTIAIYVRESIEDGGTLIVSRLPLRQVLQDVAESTEIHLELLNALPGTLDKL